MRRYEDNFDAVNNFLVSVTPTDKSNIAAYGNPEKFLEYISFLLGKQSYAGAQGWTAMGGSKGVDGQGMLGGNWYSVGCRRGCCPSAMQRSGLQLASPNTHQWKHALGSAKF